MPVLSHLVDRWQGPVIAAFQIPVERMNEIQSFIASQNWPSRLVIIVRTITLADDYYDFFPINYLRNLCLRLVATTHFFALDKLVLPSCIAMVS